MKHTVLLLGVLAVATFSISPSIAAVNVCDDAIDGLFLADPTNCSQYYTCWDHQPYERACPDGLLFTAEYQSCSSPPDAKCIQKCNSTLTTFAYDKTCTKYILCFDGKPVFQQCLDNLQYNSATDRCDYPQVVDCQANMCTAVNNPDNIVFLTSKASCSKYFICYNGQAVPMECTNGLLFNIDKKGCDYRANVDCNIAAVSRAVMPYSKMPPIKADIVCPAEGSHFLPHEQDKSSYYFCMNGEGVVLTCSPGLVYDKTMETCREPENIH